MLSFPFIATAKTILSENENKATSDEESFRGSKKYNSKYKRLITFI